jgi:uncharacterized membrane protein
MRAHMYAPRHLGDTVCNVVGSWTFIIIESILLALWITSNSVAIFVWEWDPTLFMLLNLYLSLLSAYIAPIIVMSQKWQDAKDRYRDDIEAGEVQKLYDNHQQLMTINERQLEILHQQNTMMLLHQKPDVSVLDHIIPLMQRLDHFSGERKVGREMTLRQLATAIEQIKTQGT